MGNLASLKKDRLTVRSISVESFVVDENRVLIEGRLEDRRHVQTHSTTNKRLAPGPYHEMAVRFLVGEIPPKILDAEVEMSRVPYEECPDAADSIKGLVGLPLSYGFSKEVKERLGGTKGCVHLTSLVLATGSASLQGWAASRRRESLPPQFQAFLNEYIKDSCRVWRADGEAYRNAKRAQQGAE